MRKIFNSLIIALLISTPAYASIPPAIKTSWVLQGETAQIIIEGIEDTSQILSVTVSGNKISPFIYNNKIQALYGVDINQKIGDIPVVVTLKDKTKLTGTIQVLERKKPTLDFSIPDNLGGNTKAGEKNVASLLSKENRILANLWTNPKKLWGNTFVFPLKDSQVTDSYGYARETGTTIVTHKGTDFKASEGTPVYAINRGVVRLVKSFALYGNTVIIDHGQGVMSFYMHLSKTTAKQGHLIEQGEEVGKSGKTGYALGEHLHLTIRANGVSVDPIQFLGLYGKTN